MTSHRSADIADACRCAGLEFMRGVGSGWSTHDLVAWLVGSYHAVARSGHVHRELSPEREPLSALMVQAQGHVIRTLERHASMGCCSAFICDLEEKGALELTLVAKERVWVPCDHARLAFRDRVMSLFAADALLRPADYQSPMCGRCGGLSLDGHAACVRSVRPAPPSTRPRRAEGESP